MNRNKGFTLVEILIVVIILGILAAIVIPQFTQASDDARLSSLQSDVQTVRSQLELYRVQMGDYPSGLTDLLSASSGYGPWLKKMPQNPFADTPNSVSNTASDTSAWYYDPNSGAFRPNDGGSTGGVTHDDI